MKAELYGEPYGDDLMVVNMARVSFHKFSSWESERTLSKSDQRLIAFLARGMTANDFDKFIEYDLCDFACEEWKEYLIKSLYQWRNTPTHWAPFAHPHATFHMKAPIFVARQLAKHQIGFTWSEVSRRYVRDNVELYWPDAWRKAAKNVKQGSSSETVPTIQLRDDVESWSLKMREFQYLQEDAIIQIYEDLLDSGVCPEQARMVLPQNMYTEWMWTGSLWAWARACKQRLDPHTQQETRELMKQVSHVMSQLYPVSWRELMR
jgi:thymidylate synthase (FAD)